MSPHPENLLRRFLFILNGFETPYLDDRLKLGSLDHFLFQQQLGEFLERLPVGSEYGGGKISDLLGLETKSIDQSNNHSWMC